MSRGLFCCLLISMALTGCSAPGPTKSFDISVQNKSGIPVMLWLSKDGPPAEKGWLTTEQFLQSAPGTPSPGVRLSPDKTADTGKVSGKFPQGTHAILEVFPAGQTKEELGKSGGGGMAIRLAPGKSNLTVAQDAAGKLIVTDAATGQPIAPQVEP